MDTNKAQYALPHDNPELKHWIDLASQLADQAQAAETSQEAELQILEDMIASATPDDNLALRAVVLAGEAARTATDAALKARSAEAEIVSCCLDWAKNIRHKQQQYIQTLEHNIRDLYRHEEALRRDLVDSNAAHAYNTDNPESQILLDTLEKVRNCSNQLELCRGKLQENQENIEYLSARQIVIQKKIDDLQDSWIITEEKLQPFAPPAEQAEDGAADAGNVQTPDSKRFRRHRRAKENGTAQPAAKKKSVVWSYVKIIIVALLLAFLIRTYVFDITKVDGLSMYPTLADNDNLITSKITYLVSEPQRGDIIVFDAPDAAGEDYVKRIIGLPNEEIVIDRGMVYINGQLLDEPYLDGSYTEGEIKMVIPDGFYFVMGDNREISRDSRISDVGVISSDQIHGKVVFRLFPLSEFGSVYQ